MARATRACKKYSIGHTRVDVIDDTMKGKQQNAMILAGRYRARRDGTQELSGVE
jgi:hypothetical protein